MKILLIDPPYERLIGFRSEWYPLGLASLASFLEGKGCDVSVYHVEHGPDTEYKSVVRYSEDFCKYRSALESDAHPIWDEVKERLRSFKPDIVGISVLTPKVPSAFKIAGICKSVDPRMTVVFGGCHPTVRPDEMFYNRSVDFVVRGEGEETFSELVSALNSHSKDYHNISGLSFRDNWKAVHNKDRALMSDIDSLPLPGRDRITDLSTYTTSQIGMVMTSRGCPYSCSFCASGNMWGKTARFRSIENVLREIDELRSRYGVKNITFMDDSFTIRRDYLEGLCGALIKYHPDITWSCLTRANIISDEVIRLMKKAGCVKVDVGVESGSERILELTNKGVTLKQIRDAAEVLRRNRMYWSGFFMFGFPTETEDEIITTLNLLKRLRPDWANISIFTPYPKTPLYELSQELGMITDSPDYLLYSHQNPYLRFTDRIPRERFAKLAAYVLSEVHRYNSSFGSLVKRAVTRNYYRAPALFFQDARKVVTWLKR